MYLSALRAADAQARQHFTYKPDIGPDTWRSHADDALHGTAWAGDCDDLASTVLDLLGREGMSLADRYRLFVSTTGDDQVDHMVACVSADDGSFWIVGDTFAPIYPAGQMKHRGLFYTRLSEAGERREGNPWGFA